MFRRDELDPDRALASAVRSLTILGVGSLAAGLWLLISFGYLNRFPQFRVYYKALGAAVGLLPGAAFLVAAIFLRRGRPWAAALGTIVTAYDVLCAAAAFAANFRLPPLSPVPVVFTAAWLVATLQLLLHLRRARVALRLLDARRPGFALAVRVETIGDDQGP